MSPAAVVIPTADDRIIVTMNGILDDALSGLLLLREGIDSNNDSEDHCPPMTTAQLPPPMTATRLLPLTTAARLPLPHRQRRRGNIIRGGRRCSNERREPRNQNIPTKQLSNPVRQKRMPMMRSPKSCRTMLPPMAMS